MLRHDLVDLAQSVRNFARDVSQKVGSIDAFIQSGVAIEGCLLTLSQAIQDAWHFDFAFLVKKVGFLANQDAITALSCFHNVCQTGFESKEGFLLDHFLDLVLISANMLKGAFGHLKVFFGKRLDALAEL